MKKVLNFIKSKYYLWKCKVYTGLMVELDKLRDDNKLLSPLQERVYSRFQFKYYVYFNKYQLLIENKEGSKDGEKIY
jgi:hypothetical protein